MSGVLSIVRELLAMYAPSKYQERSVFWNCIVIAFIVSAGILLYQERQDNKELRRQLSMLTVPHLEDQVAPFSIAPAGANDQDSFVTAWISINNKGAPTILKNIALFAQTDDGRLIEGENVSLGRSLRLEGQGQSDIIWDPETYFPRQASEEPIQTNGGRAGWIDGLFLGITRQQMHNAKLVLKFSDINDKPGAREGTWSNKPSIDPRKIQRQR